MGPIPHFLLYGVSEPQAEVTESLQSHIEALVEAAGAHLVEFSLRPLARRQILEVFVDTEEGITADLLAELSRSIGTAVEETGSLTGVYQLVVSSPGLDRPLRYPWQYRRHIGRTVRLILQGTDETRQIEGRILDASDEQLVVSQGAGGLPVPFEHVEKATIVAVL